MKTLYESILSSTHTGKYAMIDKWCKEHDIFGGDYKILPNNEITYISNANKSLILDFADYTELPSYIKFAGGDNINLWIGTRPSITSIRSRSNKITSLKGIPDKVGGLVVEYNGEYLPDFEITFSAARFIIPRVKSTGNIILNFKPYSNQYSGRLDMYYVRYDDKATFAQLFPNITVNNPETFDMVNSGYLGEVFSKMLRNKAPMNKYKNRFDEPIADDAVPLIQQFFGDKFDMSQLETIAYTQNSKLVKRGNQWYRCKNL